MRAFEFRGAVVSYWLAVFGGMAAVGQSVDSVVYPTGVYPDDVVNVQAAADLGGRVLLKAINATGMPAAFNFGPAEAGSGHVTVTKTLRSPARAPVKHCRPQFTVAALSSAASPEFVPQLAVSSSMGRELKHCL